MPFECCAANRLFFRRRLTMRAKTAVWMAFMALALACTAAQAQEKKGEAKDAPPQNSGFLSDYSKLTTAPDNPQAKRWVNKDFNFKPYDKILLDPVEVWVSPTSQYK